MIRLLKSAVKTGGNAFFRLLDILFVDADHRLEGVTADHELWRADGKTGCLHHISRHR